MKFTLEMEFDNERALFHFASWLCGQGEQTYWNWMEYREEEEDGSITATEFDYWQDGKFMAEPIIRCTCGRMDEKRWR